MKYSHAECYRRKSMPEQREASKDRAFRRKTALKGGEKRATEKEREKKKKKNKTSVKSKKPANLHRVGHDR